MGKKCCRNCEHYYSYEQCLESDVKSEIEPFEFLCCLDDKLYVDIEPISCDKFVEQ